MEKPVGAFFISVAGVAISTTDIMLGFQFLALAVPTAYALWKWRQDYIKTKRQKNGPNKN